MDFDDLTPPGPQAGAAPEQQGDASAPSHDEIGWPPRARVRARSRATAPQLAAVASVPMLRGPRPAARAKAGLGAIAACGGTVLGAVLGGLPGAAAGLTAVGALRNLYRSQGIGSPEPSEQADAARSFAIGLVGVAIAGYLGYKAFTKESRE